MLVTGERCPRKYQNKSISRTRNVSNETFHHDIRPSHEGLLYQANALVIEHPTAVVLVRTDDVDCIHWVTMKCVTAGTGSRSRRALIGGLESEINNWQNSLGSKASVTHTSTAMTEHKDDTEGRQIRLAVTIWYEL
jgi:hypothetical protein